MRVLTCTDLAGRGFDFKNIEVAVNYQLPNKIESFVHRIGRTGRRGKQGRSVTFLDPKEDAIKLKRLISLYRDCEMKVPAFLFNLRKQFTSKNKM